MCSPRHAALMLWLVAGSSGHAAELLVPEDYSTIQDALDVAVDDDVISVASGTYFGTLEFRGHDVSLVSRAGPATTILDGAGSGSVVSFVSGEGPGAVLEGFTIQAGTGTSLADCFGAYAGGGVLCLDTSPTLLGNCVRDNALTIAGCGGGLYARGGAPHIEGNVFEDNVAVDVCCGRGGGVALRGGSAVLVDNVLRNNGANSGGGLSLEDATADVRGNRICGNTAALGGVGGGIFTQGTATPRICGNVIEDNIAALFLFPPEGAGGGVAARGPVVLEDNRILRNMAYNYGGGVYLENAHGSSLAGNIIAQNEVRRDFDAAGGGVYATGSDPLQFEFETVTLNVANLGVGGIQVVGTGASIAHSIVWGNAGTSSTDLVGVDRADYCDVQGGWSGVGSGNFDADPEFIDPLEDRYELASTSPCVETGDPAWAELEVDQSGRPRLLDGDLDRVPIVDLGALEFGHVSLRVDLERSAGSTLALACDGTWGLTAVLFLGAMPGLRVLPPYGLVLVGDVQTVRVLGTIPQGTIFDIPPTLAGARVWVQALALDPSNDAGNVSNVITWDGF